MKAKNILKLSPELAIDCLSPESTAVEKPQSDLETAITPIQPRTTQRFWSLLSAVMLLLCVLYWRATVEQTPSELTTEPLTRLQLQPLTSDDGVEYELSVSKAGRWMSYLQRDSVGEVRWWLQDVDTGQRRPIAVTDVRTASLSPDGRWLLYERCDARDCALLQGRVDAVDPLQDRVLLRNALDSQLKLAWQPDGQTLYVRTRADKTQPYQIVRLELSSLSETYISDPLKDQSDIGVAVSADGMLLGIASYQHQNQTLLRILAADNLTERARIEIPFSVSHLAFSNEHEIVFGCGSQLCRWRVGRSAAEVVWSLPEPVQSLAVSDQGVYLATIQQRSDIWRQPRNTRIAAPAITSSRLDWMPRAHGEHVVFLTQRRGVPEIWQQQDQQSAVWLANLPEPAEFVRLSRSADGARLAFSHRGAVYLVELPGGQLRQVLGPETGAMVVNFGADDDQLIYSRQQHGEWQLWLWQSSVEQPKQLTQQGGYSGYFWRGELWFSKFHQDGLYRLNKDGQEQFMLADFNKINWQHSHLIDDSLFFYDDRQGIMQFDLLTQQQSLLYRKEENFLHQYHVTKDAVWYVKQQPSQGDIYFLNLSGL